MNVLFYVEPLIVRGSPELRLSWIYFSAALMKTLEPDPAAWPARFRIVTGEHLRRRAEAPAGIPSLVEPGTTVTLPAGLVVDLPRDALRAVAGLDAMQAAAAWYEGRFGADGEERMASLIRSRTGAFEPEVVITFSASPFLRRAFPGAVVLNHESGMVSRPPFPPTMFFDPCGAFRHSALRRLAADLRALPLGERQRDLVARIRRRYLDGILIPRSPFAGVAADLRTRYDSLWVLPLQGVGAIPMDAGLPFRDQFDYVAWLLDEVGPRVGVILTQHPAAPYLTAERIRYFLGNHPNAVILPEEAKIPSSTHFLLGIADGIISLVSNTGLQSLLWRKKLVTVGDNQATGLADATTLTGLSELAHRPWDEQRDAILVWLLTRYYRTYPYLYDRPHLRRVLTRAVEWGDRPVDLSFFEPPEDEAAVIDRFVALADPDVP